MFKLLLVCVIASMASARPGGLGYGGYSGLGHYGVLPAATSYRVDVHHTPVVAKTYVAPLVSYSAPLVTSYGLGHGYGHGLGYGYGIGHGYGLGHGYAGLGHGYSLGGYGHGW
ncbi:unnamed protein product [Diabrotica balteata]|uniref:Uncharacterized protein n=1 Tax=Diabrotica balteata TaxID=107213 RepID=A0A9N9SZP1_DIABA|nr:unnamed protein product [Diabrotica balteata]